MRGSSLECRLTDGGFEIHVTYDQGREYKYRNMEATATRYYRQNPAIIRHWNKAGCPKIELVGVDHNQTKRTPETKTEVLVYRWA